VAQNRLGRERKYASLEPGRTALLVIDMQNAFLVPGAAAELPHGRDIVPNINRIASAVRASGGVVAWISVNFARERAAWSTWFDHHMSAQAREGMIASLSPGNPGFLLYAGLETRTEDLYLEKTRFSAFLQGSSNLHGILGERSIDTVIITGVVTNTCCESTARDAMQLNYRTLFVSDGNATRTDEEHNATLVNMLQTFAEVLDSQTLCHALATGGGEGSSGIAGHEPAQ
jgi:ureidoacrylate peracid hydrolase